MGALATITSKRQLTIPIRVFKSAGLRENQKVLVREEGGIIQIETAASVVERLAGSVKIPKRFRRLTADQMIEKAKREYFTEKFEHKR